MKAGRRVDTDPRGDDKGKRDIHRVQPLSRSGTIEWTQTEGRGRVSTIHSRTIVLSTSLIFFGTILHRETCFAKVKEL